MFRFIWVLLAAMLPGLALADCVNPQSLDHGVTFNRADGRAGLARRVANGVFVDYAAGAPAWTDQRQVVSGVFEQTISQYFQDDPDAVGGGSTETTRHLPSRLPTPVAGQGWSGKIFSETWQNNSSETGGYGYKARYAANYVFLAEKSVRLSGCTYRVIPVEANFANPEDGFSQRWLYFPDLGFGLETRVNGNDNGLTALKPAG